MTVSHLTTTRFSDLSLPEPIAKGVTDAGFINCTPIQAQTLPLMLEGRDIAGQAQTGTGKTAAFLLATFNHLLRNNAQRKPRAPQQALALIMAPTRELAVQIYEEAMTLGAHTGLRINVAYGGLPLATQRKQLEQGVDLIIGTPGRLIDCLEQRWINLRAIEVAVLDEADRMFDLGFLKQLRYILRRMPHPDKRLNLLFSATLSWRVMELAYEHMNSPTLIKTDTDTVTSANVDEWVFYTENKEKIPLLLGLFKKLSPTRAIIFANTKSSATAVADYLASNDCRCGLLTGDVPQRKRLELLKKFQSGNLTYLVATDVAARGLHIPQVSHVFNFDLPQEAEEYVHRIGRTARIGAKGVAVSFACEGYAYSLPDIEAYIGHRITSKSITDELLVTPNVPRHQTKHSRTVHRKAKHNGNAHAPDDKKGSSDAKNENRKRRRRRKPGVRCS